MFLKTLTMKGFKSFADPVTLSFEPGITVIVGPNGSGKSNIVDAVAWVLGAQSPKAIRSSKMEDVIFAGTDSRSALGRAEVSLTIDNSMRRLPVDIAEVTITRTLFRSGESEYALNGASCRLLDIQELLSDTGVGRQQHIIVSQGQLDSVLSAHPEERRLVIEEAAGVLKYRRRRERAERRLETTEGNLQRVGDMVKEVRRQLRPLARQAAAARAHVEMTEELLALRRHLAGRDVEMLQAKARGHAQGIAEAAEAERLGTDELEAVDAAIVEVETGLSAGRADDLAEASRRVEGLRERARGLGAVLAERRRGLHRDLDAAFDADVVATLEAEAAALSAEIETLDAERSALASVAAGIVPDRQELAERRRSHAEGWSAFEESFGRASADELVAEARVRMESLDHAVDHGRSAIRLLDSRLDAAARRAEELEASVASLDREQNITARSIGLAEGVAEAAEVSLAQAVADEQRAQATLSKAEAEFYAWTARAEAVAAALDERLETEGTALLTGTAQGDDAVVDGVVGTLGSLVEVEAGFEAAFEAAIGAAVTGVVIEDASAARVALQVLRDHDAAGSVVPLRFAESGLAATGSPPGGPTGAAGLADAPEPPLPPGARALRRLVTPRPPGAHAGVAASLIEELLDRLVGAVLVAEGWERAVEIASEHPQAVVVTRQGDRFATHGWRAHSAEREVSPAALAAARHSAAEAGAAVDAAREIRAKAASSLDVARLSVTEARRAVDVAYARRTAAVAAIARVDKERQSLAAELDEGRARRDEIVERVDRDEGRVAEIASEMPDLERRAAAARDERLRLEAEGRSIEAAVAALQARQAEWDAAARSVDERRTLLERRRTEIERRLAGHAAEREKAAESRERIERSIRAVGRLGEMVEHKREYLDAYAGELDRRYRSRLDALRAGDERLAQLRSQRSGLEHGLASARARSREIEIAQTETRMRLETLVEHVEGALGSAVDEVVAAARPELPEGISPEARCQQLEKEIASAGPVNPLALQELDELEQRAGFLDAQVEDIKGARRELHGVIRSVDEEIMAAFAAAYKDVDMHFGHLVGALFPGGSGRLSLTDPDHLLETGVEVEVRVAGRGHRKMSLLSGGERSLVALAFLFAVFRSRPSPFYLMDEVEAALDDVNLHRFLSLIAEFREEAQLLIVSHQKLTMESADALYGVTASPGSSSKVVSERLRSTI